jgi:hypothetical protein
MFTVIAVLAVAAFVAAATDRLRIAVLLLALLELLRILPLGG